MPCNKIVRIREAMIDVSAGHSIQLGIEAHLSKRIQRYECERSMLPAHRSSQLFMNVFHDVVSVEIFNQIHLPIFSSELVFDELAEVNASIVVKNLGTCLDSILLPTWLPCNVGSRFFFSNFAHSIYSKSIALHSFSDMRVSWAASTLVKYSANLKSVMVWLGYLDLRSNSRYKCIPYRIWDTPCADERTGQEMNETDQDDWKPHYILSN